MLPKRGAERECYFPKNLGSGAPREHLFIYYIAFIFKKNMQNAKLVAEYMKICIFLLLVDEYYTIMKLEMPSIVH
jgi:hypothetical protein